ncbi:MAG: rhomboid family intramembrane serine protease [Verrucomicrobiales bacterium]|nr:rhomboid family intramembrane serine protease [Verrucomicrobiales bacterium]
MSTWLLVINSVVFLIQHLIFDNRIQGLVNLSRDTLFSGQVWRLVSFQFCHADVGHFISNMLFLFFLGRMFEQVLGRKWVLSLYLLGGVIGGIAHIGLFSGAPVIGASASVIALATAVILTIPEQPISLLFLPVQFKIKYFGWFLLIGNVAGLLMTLNASGGISYISHLGGMAAGWGFVNLLMPHLRARENRSSESRKSRSKIAEAAEKQIKKKRQKETVYLSKKVDAILEKISEEGMQSLTPEEKNVLERSSQKLSKKLDDK